MAYDANVPGLDPEPFGDLGARFPFIKRHLHNALLALRQPIETQGEALYRFRPPGQVGCRPLPGCGLAGQTLRRLLRPSSRPTELVRNVAAHPEHIAIETLDVVHATTPQGREGHFHDSLCQILGFRYTAEMPQPVEPGPLPESPANLGLREVSLGSTRLDIPRKVRIAGVLHGHRRHGESLQDLFV